uniref:Polyprotein n=1 Tax=Solanum tuberosum TaxID=4113 RepID=M1DF56_SOLTU
MATSSDRPMEAAREGSGASVSQPHALEGVGEHISNQYVPHTCGSKVGNHQGVRVGPHPHLSHSTQTMNPHFEQMAEFFHYIAESMHDPHRINFEKMRKMGGVEFEGTVDPTDVEQWLDRMERVFEQLECSDVAKFKYAISLLQKDAYDWWVSVPNAKKFLRLSRYAGGIIKEEKDKCRKFEDGLNDSIRKNVAILQHEKFCKLLSAAFTWERLDKEETSRNENRFRKPRPEFGGPSKRGRFDNSKVGSDNRPPQQRQNRSEFSTSSTPNYGEGKPHVPTCPQCGKNHYDTCRRASGACFNCGSFDPKVKDYPNPSNAPSFKTEGSVHKPSVNPPQTNRGARPKNT